MINIQSAVGYQFDTKGQHYVNVHLPQAVMKNYLAFLQRHLSNEIFEQYVFNQQHRDNYTHHVTVVNPLDFSSVEEGIKTFINYPVTITIYGIGHIQEQDNEVFFLVCECVTIEKIRKSLNLQSIDLHCTLAFKHQDIFDKPKNKSTLMAPFSILE